MIMIYQTNSNNRNTWFRNRTFKFVVAFTLVSVLISFFGPARNFVAKISTPFLEVGSVFYNRFSFLPKIFSDKQKLVEENTLLSDEVENLNAKLIGYDAVNQENEELRRELGLRPKENFLAAEIIARPPQIPLDSVLINKGSKDGIKKGDAALAASGVLVGNVADVYDSTSIVALSSFPGTSISGHIERTGEQIEINGTGGGNMQSKVPIDLDIGQGDRIVVSGTGANIASIAGVIEEDKASGFKTVFFSLPVNPSRIRIIFIEPK